MLTKRASCVYRGGLSPKNRSELSKWRAVPSGFQAPLETERARDSANQAAEHWIGTSQAAAKKQLLANKRRREGGRDELEIPEKWDMPSNFE
jgi:hypothetical protein